MASKKNAKGYLPPEKYVKRVDKDARRIAAEVTKLLTQSTGGTLTRNILNLGLRRTRRRAHFMLTHYK